MLPNSSSENYTPDQLIAGHSPLITRTVTLASGQANRLRGTLLGVILVGTLTAAAASGNVGNGTLTPLVSGPTGPRVEEGAYVATCTQADSEAVLFQVQTPSGALLPPALADAAYTSPHLNFTITEGVTPFEVGDSFTVTVPAGSKKYVTSLAAATDGSQKPSAILVHDTDATSGDKETGIYEAGEFNEAAVIYGTGHTAASVRDGLRALGIHLKAVQPA